MDRNGPHIVPDGPWTVPAPCGVRISLTYKTVFHILDVKVKIQGI
jgi:hypothetical protein